jgi:phosphoribosyl-ATP pyrophosphohydrolase
MKKPARADVKVLERLYATIRSRKGADAKNSYTASLFAAGTPMIARKLGEEGLEAVLAAHSGDKKALVHESADLLYHLLVAWADAGIAPDKVWSELARREGTSGIAEKRSRKKG